MRVGMRFGLVLASMTLAALLGISPPQPAHATVSPSTARTLDDAVGSAHLPEPLFATKPTSQAEDQALRRALIAYDRRRSPEDVTSLTSFLSDYPHSGWSASVRTNLGLVYLHYGYFSRALDAFRGAWTDGKDAREPRIKALVDRAVGELVRLQASFGQNDELAKLFEEIGDRPNHRIGDRSSADGS